MRTKKETISLCKRFFDNTDDIRTLTRLCPERKLKDQFYTWWRKSQTEDPLIDASDYLDAAEPEPEENEGVFKVGPDKDGFFYYIDGDTQEVIRRVRNCEPKEKEKEKDRTVTEEIWYSLFNAISQRFNGLNNMKDRNILQEEVAGISSRSSGNIMFMYFAVLSVLGFLDPDTVQDIVQAKDNTSQSPEKQQLFISTIYDLPFGIRQHINTDIAGVRKVLDDRLYKLDDVKQKIMEHIILMIHSEMRGATVPLLLVGPPGIGKTSIAKAIARALNLPFHSFNLGGLSDNALFRGHHSSWSESTPGNITRMLITAKCENPVVLLDEIDKAGSSYQGNIQDVVSEMIDPSTNYRFTDSYIGVPMDISRCLFILTANERKTIPDYLLDRCQTITIRQYTQEERAYIIKKYLLAQVCGENFLQCQVSIDSDIVERLSQIESLREVKRIIRSGIAKALAELKLGDVKNISLGQRNMEIKGAYTKSAVGFAPAAKRQ